MSATAQGAIALLKQPRPSDAKLLEGLVARDPHAVAELFDAYASAVRRVLVHALGGLNDVDDIMQDTFLTVVDKCDTVRDPNALRSFVVSVAIRLARNEVRKRAVRRFVGLEDLTVRAVTPAHDPEVAEGMLRLYQVLGKLDADSRMAFVVRHVEGYELTETAELCACSLATIKRRLAKAEKCFDAMSRSDAVLSQWLEEGRDGP